MELTRTTTALLEGLRDSENAILWEAFDRRYRPILVGFARNLGLDEVDAADVAQETLSRFVQEYREGRYDRSRGRLGAWLVGIARYRILDLRRKRAVSREGASGTWSSRLAISCARELPASKGRTPVSSS